MHSLSGEIAETIASLAQRTQFSGAIRVTADRAPVFEAAYGHADRARQIANTVDTRFGVASGVKLFTALGIGALIDDSAVAMSDRLVDLVSCPLPNVSRDVTLRHLLTHTSGVFDYYDEDRIDDFDNFELAVAPYKLLGPRDYLPLLVAGPQKFAPGAQFSYSNGGYVLLGLAIEEVAGRSYHRHIDERVLGPAGMTSSGFFRFDQLPDRVANGYIDGEHGWRTNIYRLPIIGGPDGGAFCTLGDIERLWLALIDGHILSPALTAAFLQRAAETHAPHTFYAHGLWIRDDGDEPARLYIVGNDAGVSFKSTCYAPGTIATVVSNTSGGAWPISDALDALICKHIPRDARGV